MRRLAMFLVCFLASVPAATADILFLDGGGQVEGVVTDLGSEVKVQGLNGSVMVPKSKIRHHMKTPFVTEVYAEKRARMRADSADDHYRLAMWCRRNGLKKHADAHLARALELDPDHADTRATLGHVKWKDAWMTREDALNLRMAERGFIKYGDRWFTEAGLLAWLDARREEQRIEAEAEQRRAEREALARKAAEEEERLKLLAAERKMVENAVADAEQLRRERDELLLQNRELIDLMRSSYWNRGWWGGSSYWGWGTWGGACGPVRVRGPICRPPVAVPYGGGCGFSIHRGNVSIRGVFR